MAIKANNHKVDLSDHLSRVSETPWSPLEYTDSHMCPRQVLPGPVFLGADGRFFFLAYVATWTADDTNQPLGYCILSISYRAFSIRISDIIFFPPHYFLMISRANLWNGELETPAYLPWHCCVWQASEFVRLFISNLNPRSRLDFLRANKETTIDHVLKKIAFLNFLFIQFSYKR